MSNEFYNPSGAPSTGSSGSSAVQRAEFVAIAAGFALLPTMTANGDLPVFVNAGGTALTAISAASARTKLGLAIGANVQAWSAELDALAALDATVGILIKTAANTYARRTLTGTANEITVTNGNGAAGNMTVSLPAALTFTGKTVSGGTFNNVVVSNTAAAIAVNSGGTGVASLPQNNVLVGNGVGGVTGVSPGTANNVLVSTGTAWVSGAAPVAAASQAQQEAAASNAVSVTPGVQQFHPSSSKAWVSFNGQGAIAIRASYNVTSLTDNGVGTYDVNLTTSFSSTSYNVVASASSAGVGNGTCAGQTSSSTVSAVKVAVTSGAVNAVVDSDRVEVVCHGDQ